MFAEISRRIVRGEEDAVDEITAQVSDLLSSVLTH